MTDERNPSSYYSGTATYDEGLRRYMLGIYNLMGLGLAATALIAFLFTANPSWIGFFAGPMAFVPFIGVLVLGFVAPRMIYKSSAQVAYISYWAYVGLWGLLIGPSIAIYAGMGLADVVYQAFFITAATFAAMSIYGYTTKRDLSAFGKFFFMASIGLLIALLVNMFFIQGTLFSLAVSGGVVLLMSGMTAYETQVIKNMYESGSTTNQRHAIFGAFMLYGSFVSMFIHILRILMLTRD